MAFTHILVPTDFSDPALSAVLLKRPQYITPR